MSTLSDALAAMDKATPGPWEMRRDDCHYGTMTEIYSGEVIIAESNYDGDTPMIAAAPDMAAWIEKALPWVEQMRLHLMGLGSVEFAKEIGALDALLAEAKGEGK